MGLTSSTFITPAVSLITADIGFWGEKGWATEEGDKTENLTLGKWPV